MPLGDKKRQLDEQVAAAVRRAVEELQQEVRSRLQEATESLQRSIGDITPRLPESFLAEDDLRSMADEAAAAARAEALALVHETAGTRGREESFAELRGALAALDRATSQAEVLQALLDVSRPHAARTAVFLIRGGQAHGWGSRGFGADDAVRAVSFETAGTPWADLAADGARGSGLRELTTAEAAVIASALESELPGEAVLVALVLRDRVAAVLYADQTGDGPLETAALQILTYSAATALETQPLRTRAATATLATGGIPAATAAISVADHWPTAEPEPVTEPPAEPMAELPVEWVAEPEPEIAVVAEPELPAVDAVEPEPEPLPFTLEDATPELELPAVPAPVDAEPEFAAPPPLASAETEAWPLPAMGDFAPAAPELPTTPSFDDVEIPAEPTPAWADPGTGFDLEPVALGSAPTMRYEIPVAPIEPEPAPSLEMPPAIGEPELPSLSGFAEFAVESEGSLELIEEPLAPARPSLRWEEPEEEVAAIEVVPEPELAPEPLVPEPPSPLPAAGAETLLVPTLTAPPPVAEAPAETAEEPTGGSSAVGGGQVQAPPDLEGPGWAFSTTSVPIAKGDEPSHEEARRLARLLVSEIQLYNQEEVEEGRRNRDLYERLKDDIDRSRQLYDERVDPGIRESTDYFYQELVRQLAAGDARALGI